MSVFIAKEHMFITVQTVVVFISFGVLVSKAFTKPSESLDLNVIPYIFFCFIIFTAAVWTCFLAKEKVELYLNYAYKADDVYSRVQLLMLYTILASILSLTVI